jgi:hypothetical protein
MAVESGLVLEGYHPLDSVLRPLTPYPVPCHWVIDDQAGPFDSRWIYGSPENEALLGRQSLDVPGCRNTSTTRWRPPDAAEVGRPPRRGRMDLLLCDRRPEREVRRRVLNGGENGQHRAG